MKLPKTSSSGRPRVELGHGDRLEAVGTPHGDGRERIAGLQGLRRAIGGEARDHGMALGARLEALDEAAVGRVDERGQVRNTRSFRHARKPNGNRSELGSIA